MRVKNATREQSLNEYVRAGPGNGPGRRGDTASRFYEAAEVGACAAPNPAAEVITPAPRFGEGTCRRQTAGSACHCAGDGVWKNALTAAQNKALTAAQKKALRAAQKNAKKVYSRIIMYPQVKGKKSYFSFPVWTAPFCSDHFLSVVFSSTMLRRMIPQFISRAVLTACFSSAVPIP